MRSAVLHVLGAVLFAGVFGNAAAATSNVAATRHNLSASGQFTVKAPSGGESQICAFCHTPHSANTTTVSGPLWNRNTSGSTYTRYTSSSLDASTITDGFNTQPAGSSLLCLSCHDGMVALGNVNVLNGVSTSVTLNGTATGGTMTTGSGILTGYTRTIGTYLGNDHPISISFNDALAAQDGELQRLTTTDPKQRDKITGNIIGIPSSGYKPLLPLEPTGPGKIGQVQCATCHDPHITAQKFLRLNRFQAGTPTGGDFSETNDQICLACHVKLGTTWSESAHANPTTADETYIAAAATQRDFPGTPAVWQVACLNCHDTHTVTGSRRLLREGVGGNASGTGAGTYQQGADLTSKTEQQVSALENTCYQCHQSSGTRIIGTQTTSTVPDIMTAFGSTVRMPITTADQKGTNNFNDKEIHDITNANFIEPQANLGFGNTSNRHVECTDCHNPHRVRRSSVFYGTSAATGEGAKRTHNVGGVDGNIASGVLRGAWGVEPVFGAMTSTWPQIPSSYTVKKGDPTGTATDSGQLYLTREYQLCFKCHSDYANSVTAANFPALGNTSHGTLSGTNSMTRYTNVAAEFGSVNATAAATTGTDQGEYGESTVAAVEDNAALEPAGSYPADTLPTAGTMTDDTGTQNHRSWHPVMYPTGRTRDERRITNATYNFRTPFAAAVGTQTMHCSDCHGHSNSWTAGTGPDTTKTQGPHGSDKNFLLKGDWSTSTTIGGSGLCFNCHNPTASSTTGAGNGLASQPSGFNNDGTDSGGGHGNAHNGKPCMRCHIAVPHGWKNKAFLVNLNCVGPEVSGKTSCDSTLTYANYTGNSGTDERTYTAGPYYVGAFLRVKTWKPSGNWSASACGAVGAKNTGTSWMDQGSAC